MARAARSTQRQARSAHLRSSGAPLRIDGLGTRLVANNRDTIGAVCVGDYLMRRLNGEAEPVLQAASARSG